MSDKSEGHYFHTYDWYDDDAYGMTKRCECGQLDPRIYTEAERGEME